MSIIEGAARRAHGLSCRSSLHIVHVTASLAPRVGGPATVTTRLAAAQAALGHQVTIISSLRHQDVPAYRDATAAVAHFDAVETVLTPWDRPLNSHLGFRYLDLFDRHFRAADVVHLHGVWEPMHLVAARVARRYLRPYFVRTCGVLDRWSMAQKRLKKTAAFHLVYRRMLERAAFIHTLSKEEGQLMRPLGLRAPRVIIPNGFDAREAGDEVAGTEALHAAVPAIKGHPYALFLGRLHRKKGLDILADAFAQIGAEFPQHHLLVLGHDGGAREEFVRQIKHHRLEDRVHLAGQLVGLQKFAAIRGATCLCQPSRQEGFSNSIVEAMGMGVPVAVSTECHFDELQRIGAGMVFPLNHAAAANALRAMLSMAAAERARMGNAGRAYVNKYLTWPRIASQTIDAYCDALGIASATV